MLLKFMHRTRQAIRSKGLGYAAKLAILTLFRYSFYSSLKLRRFKINDRSYSYFIHPYGVTWQNERSIEVPFIWKIVRENMNKSILEVGNVLSHYHKVSHDVVDKYEKDNNVTNVDIIDYKPGKKYDLIVCISTLEHIGYDEPVKDANKNLLAIERLKYMLNNNGKIVITVPIGYNKDLQDKIGDGRIKFDKAIYMKRIGKHTWKQSTWDEVKDAKQGIPFRNSNAILIGEIYKN